MSEPARQAVDLALEALRGKVRHPEKVVVTALSVDEAILLDQIGYEPVGFLTGASVVQMAAFARMGAGFSTNTELTELSDALGTSRRRSVLRLSEAGLAAGADGVVGVALDVGDIGGGSRLVHLVATGTGIRTGERATVGRADRCFTAALSGQEVHLLVRAGYRPLGIVSGVCAYHVGRRGFSSWANGVKVNQEMTIYTEALYDARELAMGRLQDEALELGADGVVGVTVTERTGVWGSHVIEFAAIGTAVVLAAGTHQPLGPRMVMDLDG